VKQPPPPGGTEACPDDKNKPGCPCTEIGKQAPCWTGLRANRNLGICKDGVTTCVSTNELASVWGACEGEVLPRQGFTTGANACKCFSKGKWHLDGPIPCIIGQEFLVSTVLDGTGERVCPPEATTNPPQKPSQPWTEQSLQVDCAGKYKLCFELKGGDIKNPKPSDCSIMKQCFDVDYKTENVAQKLPPFNSWMTANSACAAYFYNYGAYAEMSVKGQSVRCDTIDDGKGNSFVFHRFQYCPARCNTTPNDPICQNCTAQGADGQF
jgi:hypothetical protein